MSRVMSRVPWASISSGVGNCESVSRVLDYVASPQEEVRGRGYWCVDNVVVIQGSLYEGAFFVAPFLLKLLETTEYGKVEIFRLQFEIANGLASEKQPVTYDVKVDPFLYYMPSKNGINEPLQIACRSAVLKGAPLFLRELTSNDKEVRKEAVDLLGEFSEHRALWRHRFEEMLLTEADSDVAQLIRITLRDLSRH